MNCLRTAHIAEKCRALLMCKKCTRHHHTLLHRDAEDLTQRKPENMEGKKETQVAARSVSKQVLLMMCKLKVSAPDGSSTIARALFDSGSSTSFVHERIEEHLRLPYNKKNVMVEGVGGTRKPTWGSIWFQVSGVEDNAEKIRAVFFVMAGGLDLEAHHPGDVVDVTNHTLEQDELKYMIGLRHSCAAVLTTYTKKDLRLPQRRNRWVVGRPPRSSRRESNHDRCRILQQAFGKNRTSQCASKSDLMSGKFWRSTWETKGFW